MQFGSNFLLLFFIALCQDCDSNHTCTAPNTCECPSGWTGNDCHTGIVYTDACVCLLSDSVYMLFPADIDECEGNIVGCEHNCVNIDGHYSCTCGSENTLATDLHSCLGKLLYSLALRGQLSRKDTCSQIVQVESSFIDYSILCNLFPHNFTPT